MRELISSAGTDFLALAVTGVIVLVISLLYLWWNEQSEGKLTIPGLAKTDDTLGNLGELTKNGGLHQFLFDNHNKYGPMFSFHWGKELAVSLGSPEVWKDVQRLFDRPCNQFILFKPLIGDYSIQYLNTPVGPKHRKLLDRHFSFSAIEQYHNIFNKIIKELVTNWEKTPKEEHIPLRQHMLALALKSIVRTSFGEDFLKTNRELLELEKAYDTCWENMGRRLDGNFSEPGSEEEKAFDSALKLMKGKVVEFVNHRRTVKNKSAHTLLDMIIEADDLYTNDQQVFDMVITYLVGGFHTTGNLLSWMIYFLCQHPDVERKFLEEVQSVLGDREFTMEDMDKLTYTRQVVDESLRCSVLTPYAARFSEYDLVIGGHVIPKKTPLLLALGVVLQDEKIFPEPKKFDPDRFTPEMAKKRHPLAFQPFGFAGQRKCPGYRFAYYGAVIFLLNIVRNFKVSLVPGQKVEMLHRLVTQPKEEIYVTVEKR